MNRTLNRIILLASAALLLAGCGGHDGHAEHGQLVFKGKVTRVEYILTRGVTVITDADGKTTELEGHPGIPRAEVEIWRSAEGHYLVLQAPKGG